MRRFLHIVTLPALGAGSGFSLGFLDHGHSDLGLSQAELSRERMLEAQFDPLSLMFLQTGGDSPCSDGPTIGRDACLSKTGAKCMWMDLGSKNLCLPCEWEGIDMPCVPIKGMWGGHQVKDCIMSCDHQKVLTKGSECTDISGGISTTQCFQKGQIADGGDGEPCMWTAYTTKAGEGKSVCGPCIVDAIGQIPCYQDGDKGPEGGSKVDGCASQCNKDENDIGIPCDTGSNPVPAVPNCFPTPAPPPPSKGTLPLEVLKIATRDNAPEYFAAAVDAPYGPREYTLAAALAARTAGWSDPIPLPPDAAMVIYGPPPKEGPTLPPTLKVMYGPAPPGIPGVPPPGYGEGTAPPAANVKAANAQHEEGEFLQVQTGTTAPPGSPYMGMTTPFPSPAEAGHPGQQPVILVEAKKAADAAMAVGAPLLARMRDLDLGVPGAVAQEALPFAANPSAVAAPDDDGPAPPGAWEDSPSVRTIY